MRCKVSHSILGLLLQISVLHSTTLCFALDAYHHCINAYPRRLCTQLMCTPHSSLLPSCSILRTLTTSSEETFNAPMSHAVPPEATLAAVQPPRTAHLQTLARRAQPGDRVAHLGSNPLQLASRLQVPDIAEDPDNAGGVRMVEDDVSASFEDIEGMQLAFAIETANSEASKLCTHAEATNVERHNPHLVVQESSHIGGVDPDGPKHFLAVADHSVYLPSIKHQQS